ncbi:MAG: hypothetical protein JSV19_06975 [Phycisphaerales bacterium]|nr:MAG: hypothetical protein JSV19_06975 [Phycisphaerales bacterium]
MATEPLSDLSRQELLKLVILHARSWLAHDGCWFLAAEEKYGLDAAMALDTRSWELFSPAEARRIMKAFGIGRGGGLDALEQALRYRLYAVVNPQTIKRCDENALILKMIECRVQTARRRKGLPDFPCKVVGIVEYAKFAETIDPGIKTRCLQCPPDPIHDTGCICAWEFTT